MTQALIKYCVVDPTGFILFASECPESEVELQSLGYPEAVVITGHNYSFLEAYYDFASQSFQPTQKMSLTKEVDGLRVMLRGIPAQSEAFVNDQHTRIEDGELEIEFDQPGKYVIEVRCSPRYISEYVEVNVG